MTGYSRWQRVEDVLLTHYHSPDLEAARALYSAFAAHRLSGSPVWPMIVAPPGSMKTELLNALDGQKGTHFIDQITQHTFISGQIERPGATSNDPPPGLLNRIGPNGIIVFSDFSTILAMPTDRRAVILADMRRIYDGSLSKEYGTAAKRKSREWKGRITFLVAATPTVDGAYSIFQALGERFVMIRCHRADGVTAAMSAITQNTAQARSDLKGEVRSLFAALPQFDPQLSGEIAMKIASLTEVVVRARTHIPRDGNKKIAYAPEPEAPTRLAQQLAQLSKGSALLDNRYIVNKEDYKLVLRVGMDCIPAARRKVLEYHMTGDESKIAGVPASTRSYAEEELEVHGLLMGSGSSAQLSIEALGLMSTAGLI